jgi:acyl-CoA reductase-like NAD-dependent aldehyde dehydrogenase
MNADALTLALSDEMMLLFLDGSWKASESATAIDVINPSNAQRCWSIPAGCAVDVDRAVASARRAFLAGHWSDAPPSLRKRVLHRWAELVAADSTALDLLDACEMGKPIAEKLFNAASAAELVRFYSEAVDKVSGDVYSSDSDSLVLQRRVPRGVVAAVVPWNFPVFNAVLKAAPALAAGNCVVLKPSELSSRSALRLAELATRAGLPPGALNVVLGEGEIVGRALGLHSDVDMMAFTGSTEIGKQMLQYAGQSNMKVTVAECGGKSPHVVFGDGLDLDVLGKHIARSLTTNQGQICSVGSRLIVQRSVERQLVGRIKESLKQIVMGDATDAQTTFGPLASATQCQRVMRYIEAAHGDGAEVITGGHRARRDSGGYFVEPTVLRVLSPGARIAQEEVFGPVLTVLPFDDEAEAVALANSTIYGLIAYVWTASLSTGMRMAKSIRSSVLINAAVPRGEGPGHAASSEPTRQSGLGTEGGLAGMETYLRRQLVWINHA